MTLVVKCSFLVLTLLNGLVSGQNSEGIDDITTPPSGCQLCASSGDCSRSFRDGPGQYCGIWMDRSSHELPCCCPLNAVCNVSPADYVCTCAYVGAMPPYHSESDFMNKVLWLWWILGIIVVVTICGICLYFLVKQLMSQSDEGYVFSAPEVFAPLVSPTREALYGSTRQIPVESGVEGVNASGNDGNVEERAVSHPPLPDDLEVGGDGFDGGLGVVGEVEGSRETVSAKV